MSGDPIDEPDGTGEPPHPAGPWGSLPETDETNSEDWLDVPEDES